MPAPTPTLLDLRSQQASNHIYFTYQFVPQPSLLVGKGRGREGGRKVGRKGSRLSEMVGRQKERKKEKRRRKGGRKER